MARISSREYELSISSLYPSLSTESRTIIERYEKDILSSLPDIDKIEQNIVDENKAMTRSAMSYWRTAESIRMALSKLLHERKIREEDYESTVRAMNELSRAADDWLDFAKDKAIEAHTIENYGLKAHSKSLIEEHILPLIVSFVGIYLLLKKWKG